MKKVFLKIQKTKIIGFTFALFCSSGFYAQSAFDIIAASPNHTYLETALIQEGLDVALADNNATLTVFAPDDNAFTAIATGLGTDIAGLLALPNLTDILSYHVLGTEVASSAITNGAIVQPLSPTNTLKLTLKTNGDVFVNQAQVTTADINADNGIVHVLNAVVLPAETVVDVAIDNGFTSLTAAVVEAELLPALTNPLATLTVFAPTNTAFDNIATGLGVTLTDLLNLPNLADILTYHVLGTEVASSAITNGAIVQPLSPTNTLKLTLKTNGDVFVNQAQVTTADINADNGIVHVLNAVVLPAETVVDVAIDNGFTSLTAAVVEAELLPALTNPLATLTVFAPTNTAFDNIATGLGVTLTDLLNLPNLADILTYHVLGTEVASSAITNGAIVQPLSPTNTLKLTLKTNGDVFVNQAQVTTADINADNGIVHVLNAVVLPAETVVDVAIDNGFTSLTAAVVEAELLPALTNPLATLTVFAPTNTAFDNIATGLGVTLTDLLNLPNLADILTYHVLGTEVASSAITNGAIVQPLSPTNTLKLTLKTNGDVFVNQAQVTTADINADNGIVHVLNAVILPSETVVDVAIDNGYTSLTAAVVKAELLPALTNPLATLTVFAPTNTAFDNLATALGTDLAGVLASPNLTEILTYHVLATEVTSTQLVNNSNVPTLNGQTVLVTTTPTVKINESNVTLADVQAQNGVVHVIDAVLLPGFADITEVAIADLNFYPNPATENISFKDFSVGNYQILNSLGQVVNSGNVIDNKISVLDIESGSYIVRLTNEKGNFQGKLIKQ